MKTDFSLEDITSELLDYVYELIRRGLLPAMKLGSYKVRAESLEKFLADSEGKDLTDLDDVKDLPK